MFMTELLDEYERRFGVRLPVMIGVTDKEMQVIQECLDKNQPITVDELEKRVPYDSDKIY